MRPETRRLILAWVILMGLTTLIGFAGDVAHASRLGALWLAVIGVVTVAKARLVLARYLRLEVAPSFLAGFAGTLGATVAVIVLSYAVVDRPIQSFAAPAAAIKTGSGR